MSDIADNRTRRRFSVKAETHAGNIVTLRTFRTRDAADSHPVKLALWKRVWIEEIENFPPNAEPDERTTLPPLPWRYEHSGLPGKNGVFNLYLVDATGRKIAAIWGRGGEKSIIAEHILNLVNKGVPDAD